MKSYDQIKDMLCDELEEIAKKKELTTNSLDVIYKSVDVLKDIKTIESMEQEYPSEGYSQGWYNRMPVYAYDEAPTHSYARRRDSMGRYSGDEHGYSRDTKEELRHMMDRASSDREREAIRKAMESM